MVSHIFTVALQGLECILVDIQVMLTNGMPSFTVVGLPNKTIGEARDRIKAALSSLGISLPPKKIIVNLSPADILKTGSHYDLPIALGILIELGVIKNDSLMNFIVVGELSLDGKVIPVSGVLPSAIKAKNINMKIICPKENKNEAIWASKNLQIIAVESIFELIDYINNSIPLSQNENEFIEICEQLDCGDISDIRGQHTAVRALEIAVAGRHNILMSGPPGIGKSMLATRICSIIPPLSEEEILENNLILSITGKLKNTINKQIPFRAPHHSISPQAMVGGGKLAKPGEITMAHNGILFLDEFPEFSATTINTLRQPLETKNVTITRVESEATYPANFQLIAAMNPCKCGNLYDKNKKCRKAPYCGEEYIKKINNPILDRIDMFIILSQRPIMEMFCTTKTKNSAEIKKNIIKAREIQKERYKNLSCKYNSELKQDIENTISICKNSYAEIKNFVQKCNISFRGYHKMLRIARTIADIEESDTVNIYHIKEAYSYRMYTEKQQ